MEILKTLVILVIQMVMLLLKIEITYLAFSDLILCNHFGK